MRFVLEDPTIPSWVSNRVDERIPHHDDFPSGAPGPFRSNATPIVLSVANTDLISQSTVLSEESYIEGKGISSLAGALLWIGRWPGRRRWKYPPPSALGIRLKGESF